MTTTQPTCDRCSKPVHDQSYVCTRCTDRARSLLIEVATKTAEEGWTTIARLSRLAPGRTRPEPQEWYRNPNALRPTALPTDLHKSDRWHAAVNALTTAARNIAESRGINPPDPQPSRRCEHTTCARRREGYGIGPACDRLPADDPIPFVANWIAKRLDWLRHQREAEEELGAIESACLTLRHVVDRRPDEEIVGYCPCDTWLYAIKGRDTVACPGCGTTYDAQRSRDGLREALAERLCTAAEAATLVAYLGGRKDRSRVRDLVRKWGDRGRIATHDLAGEPAYRLGEVLARLAEVEVA